METRAYVELSMFMYPDLRNKPFYEYLPESLPVTFIVKFWARKKTANYLPNNPNKERAYAKIIKQGIDAGYLKATVEGAETFIKRDDFRGWLARTGNRISPNYLLNRWFELGKTEEFDKSEGSAFYEGFATTAFNGGAINWDYWNSRTMSSKQAAHLLHFIDPIHWEKNQFNEGKIHFDTEREINALSQWLDSRQEKWTLRELAKVMPGYWGIIGKPERQLPYGMREAIKKDTQIAESVSGAVIEPKKQPSKRKRNESEGKPKERQEFYLPIWESKGRPNRNQKVWTELRELAKNENQPINKVIGNDELTFAYQDGSTEPLCKKTFQNDMSEIRKIHR